ncbi:hypothetical protein Ahy_B04g073368 [Arachis hypogaea]|uniref:Aminotransferase-like plant mobile domain-containing protein n=1 Tax=Arachis hypogaea TaxID=3818 RepID=A0A444ZQD7_ARAHY|nr:hypothetical protein Ahy_B04g073368 [Arachis hypogaea]
MDKHIVKYLDHLLYTKNEGSKVIGLRHLYAPEPYDRRIEPYLRAAGFYNGSQIRKISGQIVLINALVERWNPVTHTFHLPIGECTITLEDVALILGLQGTGLPVTGPTNSNHGSMVQECLMNFGVAPTASECRSSFIKLTWLRNVKHGIILTTHEAMERYTRYHIIMSLFGTTTYSWGLACLAHLYRSLCRATQYDCKDLDGPLALLHVWTGGMSGMPLRVSLHGGHLHILGKCLITLQMLIARHLGPDFMLHDMYEDARMWLAPSPLISFECIEWCPTDRVKRQFGRRQDPPESPKVLGDAHNMLLTGPKNYNWSSSGVNGSLCGKADNGIPTTAASITLGTSTVTIATATTMSTTADTPTTVTATIAS